MAEYFPIDVSSFGSYSGSFSGSFFGNGSKLTGITASFFSGSIASASYALSASYAATASYAQNIVISGSISNADYIDFTTNYRIGTNEPAWKEGRVFYDSSSGALAVYNWEQDVTLNVGQESWLRARNQTGTLITNGTVVRLLGAIGDRPTVEPAQAIDQTNTFSLNNEIIGMATHDIEHGTDGFITTFGIVNGVNTAAFSAGDLLWVSQSAGQFTSVPPAPPFDKIFVGIVTRANVSNGSIFMTPLTSIHFHDISSVSASAYQMGDIWMYRSGSVGQANAWINTKQLTGSYAISGGLNVNGAITGSLFGTASWATNALTASFINTASTNAFVQGGNSFGATALLGTNDNQSLAFETSGSTRMFISSSGNVGVGTTTPPYKLTVQGTTLTDSSVSAQGAFNLNPLTAPVAIGGYTLSAGSSLGVGTYYYFAVYVTALGETSAGSTLVVTTTTGNTTVNLTGIPVSSDSRVTARKIYRTKLNGSADNEWFLTTISDNVTTTFTDNIADASLTGVGLQAYKVNTTSRYITTNGTQGMILDANLTALGLSAGRVIISSNAAAVRSVFIGALAGENVTTGTANVLVGGAAGRNLTTGGSNTLIGDLAGFVISNASNNTAIGSQTARYLTTGGNNIIIGASSANVLTDGSTQFTQGTNNTILGNSIRMSTITDTNSIVIGSTAWSLGSNTAVLGNDSITRTALKGNISIGTTGSISSTLHVRGSGTTSATTALRVENTNASASFVVRDNGSVGIGTATPSVPLEVVGNMTISGSITQRGIGILFYDSNGNGGGRIHGSYNYLNGEVYITPSGSLFQNFVFSPNNGMSIGGFSIGGTTGSPPAYGLTVSGSIGIGTRVPTTQLDVSGSGRFTSNLTVTGSLIAPSITGSLQGTASYATQALSASWAPSVASNPFPFTGSAIISGSLTVTGSLLITGSVISNTDGLNRLARYGTAISGSTIGTGVTAQTIVYSQLIPANSFVAGDIVRTYYRFRKLSTNANATHNILVNTTSAVAGATTLATLTANTVHNQIKRDFYIAQGNATTTVGAAINIATDDTNNTQLLSVINWAVDQYIIYTVTLNTADSGYGLGYAIEQVL
jgi:hypothetical protein